MWLNLLGMGLALFAGVLSMYYLHCSIRSAREGDSTGSGQPPETDRSQRQGENKLGPAPLEVEESASPASTDSSEQETGMRVTTPANADPGKTRYGNLKAPNQAPMNANGFFNNAHDLIFYQPVMNIVNEAEERVLQWLAKFTMSGAEFDASDHVPGCHPGTRITILETLQRWIDEPQHICRLLWLRGPAGVGKSAILQSLAEQLSEGSKLGAALFFSRPNGRYNPTFVVPTIAYQLAVRIPPYKEYLKQTMANNPKLLEKDMERQFQALVTEPFTKLGLAAEGGRWVILLDGLDECQGEHAQVLIVNLISRFTSQHPSVPLVWVIASRPEAHLQVVFNSEEVRGSLEEHEVLANSDDACRDVEKLLRAKFGVIRQNYRDLIPTGVPWPAERDISRIARTSSGLFALAATIIHYVEDPDACDPISQLATVLSVTWGLEPGSLSTLHTLYSTTLAGVPKKLSLVLKLVLTFYTTIGRASSGIIDDGTRADNYPLVLFATMFELQQHTVYGALRRLHSVIKVPPLSESGRLGIRFYHTSFPDYLMTLEDYSLDVSMTSKFWWGCFKVLHGGDLPAYRDAVSGGRPPVPFSWDVKLASWPLKVLWSNGIDFLLCHLSPQYSNFDGKRVFDHPHPFLSAKEIQSAFERIDFSMLVFQDEVTGTPFGNLLQLFDWLVNVVPHGLSQLDLVKKIAIKDLNLACVPGAKYGHKVQVFYDDNMYHHLDWLQTYNTTPPQSSWGVPPNEELVSDLDSLRSEDPMMDVLVVGKGPSRRCVLIREQFRTNTRWGGFYYLPYCG